MEYIVPFITFVNSYIVVLFILIDLKQINRKMVNTIWFQFDAIRFGKISLCVQRKENLSNSRGSFINVGQAVCSFCWGGLTPCTKLNMFLITLKLRGIWSWWEFWFRFWAAWNFIRFINNKENWPLRSYSFQFESN